MSKRRKSPRPLDAPYRLQEQVISAMHRQQRRAQLRQAIARLETVMAEGKATVTRAEIFRALEVAREVLAGRDPRPYLGIKPKPGKVPTAAARNRTVASYFLRLKLDHPEVGDKHHYASVSAVTGFPEARLRKFVSEHRQEATSTAHAFGAHALLQMLRIVHGFPHLLNSPRESRKKIVGSISLSDVYYS
jgi:hypothetical protein